jgi:hypothetical protein
MLRGNVGKSLVTLILVTASVSLTSAYASSGSTDNEGPAASQIHLLSSSLSILSVPVPPSVLLLGSALVGMLAMGRPARKGAESTASVKENDDGAIG